MGGNVMANQFSDFRNFENLELQQSEARFRAAVEAVQGILWTNNADGQMRGEQPGWAALTGQTLDEYTGYGWSNAVHPATHYLHALARYFRAVRWNVSLSFSLSLSSQRYDAHKQWGMRGGRVEMGPPPPPHSS